jgi:hypothetical protein
MRFSGSAALGLLLLLAAVAARGAAQTDGTPVKNGFRLSDARVPVQEILPGGPGRDGIPALSDPAVVSAQGAPWNDAETVLGVALGGEARAYPLAILNWHELVNDTLGGRPILVSYCPLCGTGLVFDRVLGEQTRSFGVSGLLYRSDLLLYDRETESLWSQIESTALSGPASGTRLRVLRSELTTWGRWRTAHPDSSVLSLETGHTRDYGRSPYGDYRESTSLYFPAPLDPRYHPKMPTLGVRLPGGVARGYPAAELVRAGGRVEESVAGRQVVVSYDDRDQVFDVEADPDLEVIEGYWFAWSAFHPDASVFEAVGSAESARSTKED